MISCDNCSGEVNPDCGAMKEIKVVFSGSTESTWSQKDVLLLRKYCKVKIVDYSWSKKRSILTFPIRVFFATLWCDLTFSWFGSFNAFFTVIFSRLLGKKSIVVAGGHDVANMPELNYGLLNTRFWKYFAICSFKWCDKILAVSQYTKNELLQNIKGIPEGKVEVLYHGFHPVEFRPGRQERNSIISIAQVKRTYLARKGIENFVKSSALLRDCRFILIGKYEDGCLNYLRSLSDNIEFTGFIPYGNLLSYMQQAKVYVQISAHEAFGCALAEAMLCECIPVVTNRGAIPEVVGDTGYYVEYGDVTGAAEAIRRAMNDPDDKGKKARARIKEKFTLEERERRLLKVIEGLIKQQMQTRGRR